MRGHFLRASGRSLWTPSRITTDLWFDANDSSTIALNSNAVSQWNDKSGNGYNISQSTSGQRPAWSATGLNGKPTVVFDGSNDVLLTQNAGSAGVTNISIFAVMKYVSQSGEDIPMGIGHTEHFRSIRSLYRGNGASFQGFATWGSDVFVSSIATDPGGAHHIFGAIMSNTTSINLYRDGTIDSGAPRALGGGAALPVLQDGYSMGSLQGGRVANYYSNIEVSEVVIRYAALSSGDRELVEGYLAHKWGLSASLPSGHPYKTIAP